MAQAAGHDINYIALAGVLSQIGDGERPPVPPLNLVADFAGGGLMAAFGIVCALFERVRSGAGQYIDAAMIDGAASLMAVHIAQKGARSKPGRGALAGGAPFYQCYACRDGKYLAVGAIEPKFWEALCQGAALDFAAVQNEPARWPEMIAAFRARFAERTRAEWLEIFDPLDACVAPVLELDEAPAHPHNRARGTVPIGPDGLVHVAPAPRLARTPGTLRVREPRMGEHTREILEQAGYDAGGIAALEREGAIGFSR